MLFARFLIAPIVALATATTAGASSSEPFVTDGATLRLVTSGLADEAGHLRGALEIRLDPGWKTYWVEPGASGVPPQVDVSTSINVSAAVIHYPAPEWHEDSYGAWAGYGASIVLPITFTIDEPERFSVVEADLFLGICETICIPVQARLAVEPGSAPEDAADAAFVDAAFAALPGEADATFGVSEATLSGDILLVDATIPKVETGKTALFLAPERGYVFGVPKAIGTDLEGATFEVPVLFRPAGNASDVAVSYTLTAGGASVAGTFTLP